jgi:hypothetical protein
MTDLARSPEQETPVHEQAVDWLLATVGLAVMMVGRARYLRERSIPQREEQESSQNARGMSGVPGASRGPGRFPIFALSKTGNRA